MSYRDTGMCTIVKHESSTVLINASSIKNPSISYGFDGYSDMIANMARTLNKIKIEAIGSDIIICEMPTYAASANAAMAEGVCWGAMCGFPKAVLIPPSLLKIWSESHKGDGKKKVREKVESRMHLESYANDNIVDACGTALMVADLILIIKHEMANDRKTKC